MATDNYTVYFNAFGKNLKVKVEAENENDAKQKVKDRINFHKIEKESNDKSLKDAFNDLVNFINSVK